MTKKNLTLYVLFGIAGLALLFISRQYQAQIQQENEQQYKALQERINVPRKKIELVKDPINEKIKAAKERIQQVNDPDNTKKRRANIEKNKKDRQKFLVANRIQFPGDPRAMFLVGKSDLTEIGPGGSYTLGLYIQNSTSVAKIKNQILGKLNITSDELKPVSFTANAANGFRNQSLYEAESNGLYHMFFFASHPITSKIVILHFTIKNMSRVIEQYVTKRYNQLRAVR